MWPGKTPNTKTIYQGVYNMKKTKTIVIGSIVEAKGNGKVIAGKLGKVLADCSGSCGSYWAIDWDYLNKNPHTDKMTIEADDAIQLYKMA